MNINKLTRNFLYLLMMAFAMSITVACSEGDDPEVRTESDLVGVWSDTPNHYLYIESDTKIYSLYIETYEGETVGILEPDGYAYEPGYNFIVYMNREGEPNVYELISLSKTKMEWCWVDNLLSDKYADMSKTEILGALITEADKGFTLDYSKTVTYTRVADSVFKELLDKFGLSL